MTKFLKLILTAVVLFSLIKCEKDEAVSRDWPRLHTDDVTNITSKGALFSAEIIYRGDFKILEYGFVWSKGVNPEVDKSYKMVYSDNIDSRGFSAEIKATLVEGEGYYVKAFIKTSDYTVYGKEVVFVSMGSEGPKVNSFFPLSGSSGDTIQIHGRNFVSSETSNVVKFGDIKATVTDACDSILTVVVPAMKNIATVKLSVSISGNTSYAPTNFTYLVPELTSISPLTGTFNDTLTLIGKNFGHDIKNCTVFFNKATAKIVSFSNSRIMVSVPPEIDSRMSTIKLSAVGFQSTYSNSFILNVPVIQSVEPDTVVSYDQVITIYGRNLNPLPENNKIQIGGYDANVLESTGNYVKFYLPEQIIPYHEISVFRTEELKVQVAEQYNNEVNNLVVNWKSTWTKKADFPGRSRTRAVAFSIGDKGYYGTGVTDTRRGLIDFWEFDPAADEWVKIQDLPGNPRAGAVAFSIADKGYVGLGSENFYTDNTNLLKDFYSYDQASSSWTNIADFPGIGRHSAASFVIDDEGYVGTGWWGLDDPLKQIEYANDFWKYSPSTNTWIQQPNFPYHVNGVTSFSINSTGYLYNYDALFKLENNRWTKINAAKLQSDDMVGFSINGHGYFGLGNYSTYLVDYNPVTQESKTSYINTGELNSQSSVFVIGGKAFIITSNHDVWEFDPSKPGL